MNEFSTVIVVVIVDAVVLMALGGAFGVVRIRGFGGETVVTGRTKTDIKADNTTVQDGVNNGGDMGVEAKNKACVIGVSNNKSS